MRVFIAGATGVLGRRLISQFRAHGHEVLGLARSAENARVITSLGGQAVSGDLFDTESLLRAADGADVVVRSATAIPEGVRFRARDWAMNDRIRREGTRALLNCAERVGARMYLQEGIVWVVHSENGSPVDEATTPTDRPWSRSAIDAENLARAAGARTGLEVATLRFGAFYSADSVQTRSVGQSLVRRRLPILGRGDAVWANIHVDDAANALVAAAEAGRSGTWHVVDDCPATTAEYFTDFAQLLRAPMPRRIPTSLARLFVGSGTVDFLTTTTRTSNARIRRDLGWAPRYPSYREGLRQVVDAWTAEGFLPSR